MLLRGSEIARLISFYIFMAKPSKFISTKRSKNLAYAIGLFTADGCLSSDKRHLEFSSKDKEQVEHFRECLNLNNKITKKARSNEKIKKYYHIQFGSVQFYKFLESIGLRSRKSKIIKKLKIPKRFFSDFLRGLFDGDGNFNIFNHPESQYPQIRVRFASGSHGFLKWLQSKINYKLKTRGYITKVQRCEYLEYAKSDSVKILKFMYFSPNVVHLLRKFEKARPYFADVVKLENT